MRDIFLWIINKDMVYMNGYITNFKRVMEEFTKENGKKDYNMVKEFIYLQMEIKKKVYGIMVKIFNG